MKIHITRRVSGYDPENAEQKIRTTFAHITNKIWIKQVEVKNPQSQQYGFSLHDEQPGNKSEIDHMLRPQFGIQSPHQPGLPRGNGFKPTINMHSSFEQKIIVHCEPQGGTEENDKLEQEIKNAVGLCGDLTLEKIEMNKNKNRDIGCPSYNNSEFNAPKSIIKIPGVRETNPGEYFITTLLAEYLAKNDSYRNNLLTKNVTNIFFELAEIAPNKFIPTGRIMTESVNSSNNLFNIYHFLSTVISNNDELKANLLTSNVQDFKVKKTSEESFQIAVKYIMPSQANQHSQAANKAEISKTTEALDKLNINKNTPEANNNNTFFSPKKALLTQLQTAVVKGEILELEKIIKIDESLINKQDDNKSSRTLLHFAIMRNQLESVLLLLNAGAKTNIPDKAGKTPIDYAKDAKINPDILKALQEHSVNLEPKALSM